MRDILIEEIDAILPQTQCGKCGFPGCKPYATAIVEGKADINQCPPGDDEGIQKLAELLGVKFKPLNTAHGVPKSQAVALIDEAICIGCTFCIQSCPVDAIVGAARQMHTVIATECTGCELCIAPCPVDCISMIPTRKQTNHTLKNSADELIKNAADLARTRHQFRLQRLEREKQERKDKLIMKTSSIEFAHVASDSDDRKKAIIDAAIKRARTARSQATDKKPVPHEPD
tara:strand:- start:4980 stop:5669 length:690 start_codon:yes stop_codon:yes gene_type:complete